MDIIIVEGIKKTFNLSKKQQKINKTKEKIKIAVNDISFTAKKGEIFGLLGPNGAGKTTALRVISTLIKPDHGKVTIDGIDISDEIKIKQKICFLTNELKLEDAFTPSYMFEYYAKFYNLSPEKIKERKDYLFNKFGITDFSEVKIGDLSTGMKQKTSLVVSLAHDPEIIIFDEPTNGLDIITAKTVTDYLLELKNLGKTIILSTHIMSLVTKLCDRVSIIINGKIVITDELNKILELSPNKDLEEIFFTLYEKENNL